MINLRYHIVSLTAVFMALGLGVLAGTTVIDQRLVEDLKRNTRELRDTLDSRNEEIGGLKDQVDLYQGFAEALVPSLIRGELPGRAVVLLTDRQAPGDLVRTISETLALAGAKRPTRLQFTDRWALDQPATTQQLATVLGTSATEREKLITDAATRVAERLGGSSDPRAQGDLIDALENSGFLDVDDLPQTGTFPAANALVVVITSGVEGSTPSEDAFFIPLLRNLASTRIVGVAESMQAQRSFAEKVRGDRDLGRSVCTVDHADTAAGRLSLVFGLRDLARGRPAAHYGVRGGAEAVAPEVGPA